MNEGSTGECADGNDERCRDERARERREHQKNVESIGDGCAYVPGQTCPPCDDERATDNDRRRELPVLVRGVDSPASPISKTESEQYQEEWRGDLHAETVQHSRLSECAERRCPRGEITAVSPFGYLIQPELCDECYQGDDTCESSDSSVYGCHGTIIVSENKKRLGEIAFQTY